MKSLNQFILGSQNVDNTAVNESLIGVGATIWALEKIIGISLLGVYITGTVINAIIQSNRKNKEMINTSTEIDRLVSKYPDLTNKDICPTWASLSSAPDADSLDRLLKNRGPIMTNLDKEAESVMNDDDYSIWMKLHK